MKQPFGVILAGGLATRMGGGDKALLTLGGQTLLSRVAERLEPQVAALALNANGDPGRFSTAGLPVLPDSVPGHPGPLAGILAGLDWAAEQGGDTVVSVACDTPFFPCDLVPQLLLAAEGMPAPLALAASGGRTHPVFGLWPVALRDALRAALLRGERRVRGFAEAHGGRLAAFPVGELDPFFNINSPADLAAAETVLA
ncbi:molybdenum cofactor guanylyltransferase MobA [Salipiger sp. P9]|uniref:molybdenum cofactor guanylyltransferase MobA n=1 Tax=Salipiger pentaromativorans TaxID=2943193 RepID=UPI0021583FFC|nr:molybdenum cofactor guanylyltransferase MobA [Salipiger pentaromativorans]